MNEQSPRSIVNALSENQRDIIEMGPTSFDEANAIPEGLYMCGEIWDQGTGDQWLTWEPTELGLQVRDLLRQSV